MSADIEELRRRFFPPKSQLESTVFLGVVIKVSEDLFTCTVRYNDSVNYHSVRLRAVINGELTGLACIPKLESTVLVCRIGHSNELFVCQFSEIDKIVYTAGKGKKICFLTDLDKMELKWGEKVSAKINEESIMLANDGSTFEMLKDKIKLTKDGSSIEMLKDQIKLNGGNEGGLVLAEKLIKRLNALEKDNNNLKTVFSTWSVTHPDGGAALKALLVNYEKNILSETQEDDLTNNSILQ